MKPSGVSLLAACLLASPLAACGDDDGDGDPTTGTADTGEPTTDTGEPEPPGEPSCIEDPLPLQVTDGFTLGETFYLPAFTGADGCDSALAWSLDDAPAGSANVVYNTGAPHPRFTPDVAGTYRFSVAGTDAVVELDVVTRTPAERFRNHYLTPLYGAARVGSSEVWTANGATYTVSIVDIESASKTGEVTVGSWPAAIAWGESLPFVLVAQRGSDTLGFIDRERGVLEDALWVGDEPTGLVVSPDASTAYVSLPTMGEVAVVDLAERAVVDRIAVGFDPRALALSDDGSVLYVAAYRSGNPDADEFGIYPDGDPGDLRIVDTRTGAVSDVISGVSSVLRAIDFHDGSLLVAGTDGNPVPSQARESAFFHRVARVNVDSDAGDIGAIESQVDLTVQPSSQGPVVNPAGILATDEAVWVASESAGIVVKLDRDNGQELARATVGPGARQLVALDDGAVAVHCFESLELWVIDSEGDVDATVELAADARPEALALGERVFFRPGGGFAENHSCGSCHVETQNEGMIWNFGPNIWHNVRPIQLLASTTPLEWGAYVSTPENFGYQGPSSIVSRPAVPEEAEALGQFLASLLGAPRANGDTRLDGSYTAAALRGQELFEGKAGCIGCHTPPLYTSRAFIEVGKSGEPADVPTLLGVYRHGVYFVTGGARSLDGALDVALNYVDVELTSGERSDLLAFLRQLTPKGSHALAIWPDIDSADAVSPNVAPWVEFADPVVGDASDFVTLQDASGQAVAGSIEVDGRRVRFVPAEELARGESYRFVVAEGLRFQTGGALVADRRVAFDVADEPAAAFPPLMQMTITVNGPMGPTGLPFLLQRVGEDNGDTVLELQPLVFGSQQRQKLWARVDGDTVYLEPFALPISPGGVGDASEVVGTIATVSDDGFISAANATLRIGGPGIDIPGVPVELTIPTGPPGPPPGPPGPPSP